MQKTLLAAAIGLALIGSASAVILRRPGPKLTATLPLMRIRMLREQRETKS